MIELVLILNFSQCHLALLSDKSFASSSQFGSSLFIISGIFAAWPLRDHVEIRHLTKYDAFRVNRDQVMDLEIRFKIHTNVSNFETASPKTI